MTHARQTLQSLAFWASLVLVGSVPGLFVSLPDSMLGSINRLIGGGVALLWMLSIVASGRMRRLHLFHMVAAAFAVWYALSLGWSLDPGESPFLLGVIQGVMLTVILWDIYRTRPRVEAAMQAFVIGGYVSIGTTLANFFQGNQARHWEERFAGSGFDPNDIALLLAIGIPMAAYLVSRRDAPPLLRGVNVLYPFATGLMIVLTGSRGALLAAIPAYVFFLVMVAGQGRLWRLGLVVLLVGAVFGASRMDLSQPLERLASVTGSASSDHLSGRSELWHAGWTVYGEHPWLGMGGGAFPVATRSRTGLREPLIAHNTYLSVLTELGPVGALLFLSLIALVVRGALRQPAGLRTASLLALLVWAIGVSALSWEFRSQTWLLFVLILAGGSVEGVAQPQARPIRVPQRTMTPPLRRAAFETADAEEAGV